MRARTITLAALGLAIGCASASTQRDGTPASSTRLTQEQLATTNSDNLYEAIAKLKPEWVTSRGPVSVTDPTPAVASVYMNGSLLGKVDYLRQMRVIDVTDVRYWDPGQASARFGMGHPRGVIEVTRK
jgi:hypothetical protein